MRWVGFIVLGLMLSVQAQANPLVHQSSGTTDGFPVNYVNDRYSIAHSDLWISIPDDRTRPDSRYVHLQPVRLKPATTPNRSLLPSMPPSGIQSGGFLSPAYFDETLWFKVLFLLGLILAGYAIIKLRLRILNKRNQLLNKLVQERTKALEQEKTAALRSSEIISRQAEQLRRLENTRNRFFANISHEFRSPLTLIMTPVADALSGQAGPISRPLRRVLESVHHGSNRLLHLVNDLLELSRLESGALTLSEKVYDLAALIHEVAQLYVPTTERNRIHFNVHIEPLPPIRLDAEKIKTVFYNLISNATKYTPTDGVLDIQGMAVSDGLEIRIKNTGPGIPPEDLPYIFNRYFQASNSRRTGFGIGLSLVKELIELHQGQVAVESSSTEGTTFSVWLPSERIVSDSATTFPVRQLSIQPPLYKQPEAFHSPSRDSHHSEGLRILVVDDNEAIRAYLRTILEPHFIYFEAHTAEQALQMAFRILPDLLVIDVTMSSADVSMNGYELTQRIRNNAILEAVPIIMLTAKVEPEDKIRGYEAGVDAYITKPFNSSVLTAQIDALLLSRLRLQTHYLSQRKQDPIINRLPFVDQVKLCIEANLSDPSFTVEKLAESIGLTPGGLRIRLKKEAHIKPSALLREHRLMFAASLLHSNHNSISEVAYASGFRSLSHFTRSFRKHFGVSPSTYLKART